MNVQPMVKHIKKLFFIVRFFDGGIQVLQFLSILFIRKIRWFLNLPSYDQIHTFNITFHHLKKAALTFRSSDITTLFEVFHLEIYRPIVLRKPKTMLDLGAHIGFTTLYIQSYIPDIQITCIEPSTKNYALLAENVHYNIISAAVSDTTGVTHFNENTLGANHKMDKTGTQVPTSTLLQLFNDLAIEHVDCIKMDIEGAEIQVLSSLKNWHKKVDYLILEAHDNQKDIESLLSEVSLDYTIV